ncbi:small membrane protein [Klebsiella variicola]
MLYMENLLLIIICFTLLGISILSFISYIKDIRKEKLFRRK